MQTSGHLANNMGIRGHSAGEFYPFRVMAVGTFDSLRWQPVRPDGTSIGVGQLTAKAACAVARMAHGLWIGAVA